MMGNPWDSRPGPKQGDLAPVLLFASVGFALSIWEHLEFALGHLYQAINQSKGFSAFDAFRVVDASSVRIKMIEASAEASLKSKPEILTRAEEIVRLVRNFSARRNEIAHGMIFNCGDGEFGGYQIAPNVIKINKWKDYKATYQYMSDDIFYYGDEFHKIYDKVCDLIDELNQHGGDAKNKFTRHIGSPGSVSETFSPLRALLRQQKAAQH